MMTKCAAVCAVLFAGTLIPNATRSRGPTFNKSEVPALSPSSMGAAPIPESAPRKRNSIQRTKPSSGEIREAEWKLFDLGYWIGSIRGVIDEPFRHALIAFQKIEGRPRTGRLTADELDALRAAKRPAPCETGPFHVEIDLARQVLMMVDDGGKVTRVLPVSTGNGEWFTTDDGYTQRAVTPAGRFKIYRRISGWRKSELGLMYYPNYILGGIAIHGSKSVPAYPASHGCIRIPMYAAEEFSEVTPIGTPVIVYGEEPQP